MAKNPVNPKILIILILTKEEVRRMGDSVWNRDYKSRGADWSPIWEWWP